MRNAFPDQSFQVEDDSSERLMRMGPGKGASRIRAILSGATTTHCQSTSLELFNCLYLFGCMDNTLARQQTLVF